MKEYISGEVREDATISTLRNTPSEGMTQMDTAKLINFQEDTIILILMHHKKKTHVNHQMYQYGPITAMS